MRKFSLVSDVRDEQMQVIKAAARRRLGAMIICLGLLGPGFALATLPTPTAFVHSMELGDVRQAEAWLDEGMAPDFMGSRTGSGLMIGAWEGNIDLMRLFISRGADINRINTNGESALVLAAWRGQMETVKWLIERGARINSQPRQWSALHYAVFAGHAEVADYLMAQGADIDALSTNGSSVLMMAIYEGREALARKLIEKGADRTPRNDWGDGALEWSMRYNHLNIARMLTNPEEFNIAVSQPKEKWGQPTRSMRSSKDLEALLVMREHLVERGASTDTIDRRIAAERVRIVRSELDRKAPASRAATLEVTAERARPNNQSIKIIQDGPSGQASQEKPAGFKAPPATFFGKPKMPIRSELIKN